MQPVIVLLTDFGHQDPYVGQMKGVLLRHAPGVCLVDLCHDVRAHDPAHACFLLCASYNHFPPSIFVCVVDPGVGAGRRILLARLGQSFFLAPDNGLLSFLVQTSAQWWDVTPHAPQASHTFHGRDLFAPLAAALALGQSPDSLGVPVDPATVVRVPDIVTPSDSDLLDCRVVHVDHFGNCLLNLAAPLPLSPRRWNLDSRLVLAVFTYADLERGEIGLLAGSQGVLELAMNQTSCAKALGLEPGARVCLYPESDA